MNNFTVPLTDADLLLKLKNFEDNFVERKTCGDGKNWLRAVVGFANSTLLVIRPFCSLELEMMERQM
jgi:hypothetical protein